MTCVCALDPLLRHAYLITRFFIDLLQEVTWLVKKNVT